MKTKVINVTQNDIDKGHPGDCMSCPVARAVRRAFKKGIKNVSVLEGFYTHRPTLINVGRMDIPAPDSVVEFVNAFDKLKPVEPFTFTLEY